MNVITSLPSERYCTTVHRLALSSWRTEQPKDLTPAPPSQANPPTQLGAVACSKTAKAWLWRCEPWQLRNCDSCSYCPRACHWRHLARPQISAARSCGKGHNSWRSWAVVVLAITAVKLWQLFILVTPGHRTGTGRQAQVGQQLAQAPSKTQSCSAKSLQIWKNQLRVERVGFGWVGDKKLPCMRDKHSNHHHQESFSLPQTPLNKGKAWKASQEAFIPASRNNLQYSQLRHITCEDFVLLKVGVSTSWPHRHGLFSSIQLRHDCTDVRLSLISNVASWNKL